MTGPAEASQPFVPPPPKKPKHRGRIVAAVIGGVAVVAIVAATVVVTRIGASSEVTSGGKGYVVCACETKILPKNSQGKKIKSFTVELAPANGKGKSYTIKVDGEDGFAIEDFGELPDQKYQMTITSGKGKKKSTTTMKVDYAKEGSDAPKNVELTQSKKEAKASANSKDSINKAIASVATTLEQLKSKDADDAQASYEAVSATQDVNFTAAVGEGPLNPSPDDTCQITATWTYPQVKGQGVGVAKFNKDMVQLVADTLDASKQASMDDEDSRVTMMYTAEIVSIDGDIACVRTYADSYQPPYRSERVTRSAYYNLKTGEQVSLEDSPVRHGLSFDTLKSETKQAIKTAKPSIDSVSEGNIDDDDNYTGDHFYYDGKGCIVVLDTGEFDCMAWDTHDLVAHAFDSSYSCGQDVTPERARATYVPNE